ncbi:MAG TPA: hypothetical protein PLS53_01955 [Thermoanaerobaculaceae bacterium]|nr:hypothetical protein [Thermoanaerobaculaceae bacterium]
MQLLGVAVAWKITATPAVPAAGAVAVQAREHAGEMTMLPLFVQVAPCTVAVMDQL